VVGQSGYFHAFSMWQLPRIVHGWTMYLIFFFDVRSYSSPTVCGSELGRDKSKVHENLLLLVLFVISFSISKALQIVEIQRNPLYKSIKVRPPSLHQVPILTPEYLFFPFQWVPILALTHLLSFTSICSHYHKE